MQLNLINQSTSRSKIPKQKHDSKKQCCMANSFWNNKDNISIITNPTCQKKKTNTYTLSIKLHLICLESSKKIIEEATFLMTNISISKE
ncbi:hypothetical protein QL285_084178 [Trifolium repens]|nr:hypothetical protein QL285_084178 [Trifolium repens]